MIHKAWSSLENVPYYFSRSYVKFQGHTGKSERFDSYDRPSNISKIGFKSSIFRTVWPWNLMDDLEKQWGTFSIPHQALCIISKPSVNSNWVTSLWGRYRGVHYMVKYCTFTSSLIFIPNKVDVDIVFSLTHTHTCIYIYVCVCVTASSYRWLEIEL